MQQQQATSTNAAMASEAQPCPSAPLLTHAGSGHRAATGGWRSALFVIWVEVAERFAYYGVAANLISYLTGPLQESTAAAAAAVNAWFGAASMLPLLGAAVADSWLGRYRTILVSSVLYITGLGMLTLSSMFQSHRSQQCNVSSDGIRECTPSSTERAFFYASLYLVAIAQSGHKPCVQAFGADQFDPNVPGEESSQSSFFNWWFFGLCASATVAVAIMSYIQDNVGWGIGFGLPCLIMLLGLMVFLLGTRTYRFYNSGNNANAFRRVSKAAVMAWRKRSPEGGGGALIEEYGESSDNAEEMRSLARLFPIWATCLIYGVVFAQPPTLFTKQAATLDRRIGSSSFQVPSAALQSFTGLIITVCIPLYDRVLVPVMRRISGVATGITMLQRIGVGMALAVVALVVAALVEIRRLNIATTDTGMVDKPGAMIPMSLWWIVPQYLLLGAADVFTLVGMQEFFYDQVHVSLKSLGLAFYLSILGVGSFISSFLVSAIDWLTRRHCGTSWFADNLNQGHLDYFYLLLAGLTALEIVAFLYFSASYVYKKKHVNVH